MSNETKQKHTPGEWYAVDYAGFMNLQTKPDYVGAGNLFDAEAYDNYKENAERGVVCVNAMEGIEDPEEFMSTVKEAFKEEKLSGAEVLNQFQNHFRYMDKFKTACESINPDNPMVVAEHIETLVDYVNLCLKSPHLHEIDKILGRELLNKIKSK